MTRGDPQLIDPPWAYRVSCAYRDDAAKRPTSLTLTTGGNLSQAYDRAGNVITEARSLTGPSGDNASGTATYTYDRLSRLTGESGLSAGRSYTYDQDGNRATKVEGTTTFSYASTGTMPSSRSSRPRAASRASATTLTGR